ncbi:hypothetical protein [Methanosalsum natronophilum]|nr:hypothetical protein [Methanosalsum natronophilum]MCS3923582.1 hypothetical protein [Methanosalsum natronophilum]
MCDEIKAQMHKALIDPDEYMKGANMEWDEMLENIDTSDNTK